MKFYHQLVWEPLFCRFWPVVYDSDSSELLERQGYLIGADVTWRWSHWQLWGHWSGTCSKWFGSCHSLLKIYVIMIIVCIWKENVQKHEFVLRWYQLFFRLLSSGMTLTDRLLLLLKSWRRRRTRSIWIISPTLTRMVSFIGLDPTQSRFQNSYQMTEGQL